MKWLEGILFELIGDFKLGKFGTFGEQDPTLVRAASLEPILAGCILSSGWRYEKAKIAGQRFSKTIAEEYRPLGAIPAAVAVEFLASPDVRHRFPTRRGEQLTKSFERLWQLEDVCFSDLHQFDCEFQLRDYVADQFPGLGLKQASMFLRDGGIACNLAIIDTHIVWYFNSVKGENLSVRSVSEYKRAEQRIIRYSDEIDIEVGILDMLIWNLVRSYKNHAESRECRKQSALRREDSTPQLAFTF